jgi:hypothetical protein
MRDRLIARHVPTEDNVTQRKASIYTYLGWDFNPSPSGPRQHAPYTMWPRVEPITIYISSVMVEHGTSEKRSLVDSSQFNFINF